MPLDGGPRRLLAGREVAGVFGLLAALVLALLALRATAVRLPGYLIFLGFEAIRNALVPGLGSLGFYALFVGYLYALAVVFAVGYRLARLRWG